MRKVVWERGTWLSLKRWGVLEIVVNAKHSRADSQLWRRLEKKWKGEVRRELLDKTSYPIPQQT